jgi:hypothetical protein
MHPEHRATFRSSLGPVFPPIGFPLAWHGLGEGKVNVAPLYTVVSSLNSYSLGPIASWDISGPSRRIAFTSQMSSSKNPKADFFHYLRRGICASHKLWYSLTISSGPILVRPSRPIVASETFPDF